MVGRKSSSFGGDRLHGRQVQALRMEKILHSNGAASFSALVLVERNGEAARLLEQPCHLPDLLDAELLDQTLDRSEVGDDPDVVPSN
jgi:hypothetical protein